MLSSAARHPRRVAALTVTAAIAVGAAGPGLASADTVRAAKKSEIVAMYAVLRKPKVSSDKPPASVRAKITGTKPALNDWRRVTGAKPIEQGGLQGLWIGPTKNSGALCYGYRTTEGQDFAGCTTVNIRTPHEPQLPISAVFGAETIDDASAPLGTRIRERLWVVLPDGSSQVKVSERGQTDTRPLPLSRNGASAQVVGPWCVTYKLEGEVRKLGRDCPVS